MNTTAQITKEIKQTVLGIDPTAEVILFGSRARGDFHEESDWDVLVLTDKEVDFIFKRKITDQLYPLQLKWHEIISTIVYNRNWWQKLKPTEFYRQVTTGGILL